MILLHDSDEGPEAPKKAPFFGPGVRGRDDEDNDRSTKCSKLQIQSVFNCMLLAMQLINRSANEYLVRIRRSVKVEKA